MLFLLITLIVLSAFCGSSLYIDAAVAGDKAAAAGAVTWCAARTVNVCGQQPVLGRGSLDMLCCISAGVAQHKLVKTSRAISFLCQVLTRAAAAAAVADTWLSIHMKCS
jgi:hypothetical protein